IVCVLALAPRTSPPHTGHLSPQPAPDPVALTYAPQSTTPTLHRSVAQAKRATYGIPETLVLCAGISAWAFDEGKMAEGIRVEDIKESAREVRTVLGRFPK